MPVQGLSQGGHGGAYGQSVERVSPDGHPLIFAAAPRDAGPLWTTARTLLWITRRAGDAAVPAARTAGVGRPYQRLSRARR